MFDPTAVYQTRGVPVITQTDRWERVVSTEWNVIAWPPSPPDADRLGDVFEGLP